MKSEPLHTSVETLYAEMGNTIVFPILRGNSIGFEGLDNVSTIRETTYVSFIGEKHQNIGFCQRSG